MIEPFRALSLDDIADELPRKENTLILYHVRSDADAIGSAFALRELLRIMNVPVYCACADELPNKLVFITDGTQESVLLDEELKIDYERVITVDSASPEQLGSLFFKLRRNIDIMIDHHAQGVIYADYYIDSDASATGEIIYELAFILKKKHYIDEIPVRVLSCIYAAICGDTGCFRFSNTTPKSLRTAAKLMELGVDCAKINSLLFDSKPLIQLKIESEVARRLKSHFNGHVISATVPYSVIEESGASYENLDTAIDIARSVGGATVTFVIKQAEKDGDCRVSMRSNGDVDVSEICSFFGGGGHKCAAGCTIRSSDTDYCEKQILDALSRSPNLKLKSGC